MTEELLRDSVLLRILRTNPNEGGSMCLAVPMKVISVKGKKAFADLGGVKREIDISLVKNIKVGDYIIVHAGFAIQKLNKKEALNTLELFKQIKNETY